MKQGIVVCTWSGGINWANLCLISLIPFYEKYPIYVAINDYSNVDKTWVDALSENFTVIPVEGDYREVGAILAVTEQTDLDEFFFFQDSIEITDPGFIEFAFSFPETASYHSNPMQFYLGKWKTDVIKRMPKVPLPTNKEEAIKLETEFYNLYGVTAGTFRVLILDKEFSMSNDSTYIETKFGEERICIRGHSLIKRFSLEGWENLAEAERRLGTDRTKWKRLE